METREELSRISGIPLDAPLAGGYTIRTLPDPIMFGAFDRIRSGSNAPVAIRDALKAPFPVSPPPVAPPEPPVVPVAPPEPPPLKPSRAFAPGSIEAAIESIVEDAMERRPPPVDMGEVDRRIEARLNGLTRRIDMTIRTPGKDPVTITGAHPVLADMIALIDSGDTRLALVGPAGTGKTTVAKRLAEALQIPSDRVCPLSCSDGLQEYHLMGRTPTATDPWQDTLFLHVCRNGGLIILDEWDASDDNVAIACHAVLEQNGTLTLKNGEVLRISPDLIVVVTMNTFGTGATRLYCGRRQLDAATMDRFGGGTTVLEVDYDPSIEESYPVDPTVLTWIRSTREKMKAHAIRRVLSTRLVVSASRQTRNGIPWETVKGRLLAPWTKQELAQIGEVRP